MEAVLDLAAGLVKQFQKPTLGFLIAGMVIAALGSRLTLPDAVYKFIVFMLLLRIGLAGGISIKGRTVKEKEVIKRTEKLVEHLPVRGPIFVQWKADKKGIPKLVEMNPRLSGGTLITVAAGGNPIRAILDEVRGKTTPVIDWPEVTVVGWLNSEKL